MCGPLGVPGVQTSACPLVLVILQHVNRSGSCSTWPWDQRGRDVGLLALFDILIVEFSEPFCLVYGLVY